MTVLSNIKELLGKVVSAATMPGSISKVSLVRRESDTKQFTVIQYSRLVL